MKVWIGKIFELIIIWRYAQLWNKKTNTNKKKSEAKYEKKRQHSKSCRGKKLA